VYVFIQFGNGSGKRNMAACHVLSLELILTKKRKYS